MHARVLLVTAIALLGACGGRALEQADPDERQPSEEAADEQSCAAPIDYAACMAGDDEPLAAIGLGCSDDPEEAIVLDEPGMLAALDPDSWRVAAYFGGPTWRARGDDDRLLVLTTGRLPPLSEDAGVIAAAGSQASEGANQNPDGQALPAPIPADALDSSLSFDQVSVRAVLEVPAGTHSLELELALLSAEYPEFVASPFADRFMVWSTSEAFTGNLATIDGAPLTSGTLAKAGWMRHVGDDPALAGTGFEGHGASGWLRARGPVVPGEVVELVMVLVDVGDAELATAVLIDELRWACEDCDDECGLRLMD